jgi:hypothetical protein
MSTISTANCTYGHGYWKGAFRLLSLIGGSEFDPYREKVTEEMLHCEIMLQRRICRPHIEEQAAYQGAAQQDFDKLIALGRLLPKLRYSSFYFSGPYFYFAPTRYV